MNKRRYGKKPAGDKRGFTLIELLAAMIILAILVGLTGRIYNASVEAYQRGTRRAELNNTARAVLDFISRELSAAVTAGDRPAFDICYDKGLSAYNLPSPHVYFYTLAGSPGPDRPRAGRLVQYYLRSDNGRYELMRCLTTNRDTLTDLFEDDSLIGNHGIGNAAMLVDNISTFLILPDGDSGAYDSRNVHTNSLPRYADIYLGLLQAHDAERASHLSGNTQADFIERNEYRYTTRVYFDNRDGNGGED